MKSEFSFVGKTAWMATMHEKDEIILPTLKNGLGLKLAVVPNFNSDALGTFSGEIERPGNQLETALLKIDSAQKILPQEFIFLSSEGAFFPFPQMPLLTQNLELLILKNVSENFIIKGFCTEIGFPFWETVISNPSELVPYLKHRDFHSEGLILKTLFEDKWLVYKDFNSTDEVNLAFLQIQNLNKSATLSPDLRAHRNENRRKNIIKAAEDLVKNAFSVCPSCKTPGFSVTKSIKGLPCGWCQMPTTLPKGEVLECQSCNHQEIRMLETKMADPKYCTFCNP